MADCGPAESDDIGGEGGDKCLAFILEFLNKPYQPSLTDRPGADVIGRLRYEFSKKIPFEGGFARDEMKLQLCKWRIVPIEDDSDLPSLVAFSSRLHEQV